MHGDDDDDDDDDGFSTEIKPYLTQREYLPSTTTNQSDLFIAKVYVLGTFRTKKDKQLQARIFNPIIHHVSDDDDDDDDELDWQGNHFCHEQKSTQKIPASREGKIESWGVLSLLGGLWNISQS